MTTFHSRAEWGARPPKSQQPALHGVQYVALHHIGGGPRWPFPVESTLRGIQAYEQNNGYVDIAYCEGVSLNGDVWELRGDVKDGATLGYSGASFSILVICNGFPPEGFSVPPQVVEGIVACIRRAQARGVVASNPTVVIEDHRWFDRHITSSPTWCASDGVRSVVGQIQAAVQLDKPVVAPAATSHPEFGESMHFYDKVNEPKRPNRHRSIDVLPNGLIFRSNGGRIGPHDYTDPTLKDFGEVKFYDIPSTFGADETFVGANYHPDGSNSILYQSRIGNTGELADRKLVFTADGA